MSINYSNYSSNELTMEDMVDCRGLVYRLQKIRGNDIRQALGILTMILMMTDVVITAPFSA